MQTSVNANKSQEIQLGGGESESGLIPKLHRSNWEENLAWNSHSICNLATVPRHGHLGVDGRMFSLTCSWLRISLPNVLLQLEHVNSVSSQTLLSGLVEKWRVEETIHLQQNCVCLCPATSLTCVERLRGGQAVIQSAPAVQGHEHRLLHSCKAQPADQTSAASVVNRARCAVFLAG